LRAGAAAASEARPRNFCIPLPRGKTFLRKNVLAETL
jgi:hypothetical protein